MRLLGYFMGGGIKLNGLLSVAVRYCKWGGKNRRRSYVVNTTLGSELGNMCLVSRAERTGGSLLVNVAVRPSFW